MSGSNSPVDKGILGGAQFQYDPDSETTVFNNKFKLIPEDSEEFKQSQIRKKLRGVSALAAGFVLATGVEFGGLVAGAVIGGMIGGAVGFGFGAVPGAIIGLFAAQALYSYSKRGEVLAKTGIDELGMKEGFSKEIAKLSCKHGIFLLVDVPLLALPKLAYHTLFPAGKQSSVDKKLTVSDLAVKTLIESSEGAKLKDSRIQDLCEEFWLSDSPKNSENNPSRAYLAWERFRSSTGVSEDDKDRVQKLISDFYELYRKYLNGNPQDNKKILESFDEKARNFQKIDIDEENFKFVKNFISKKFIKY